MKLFIETSLGRLQNLYMLQDVRAVESQIEEGKFAVAYVQANGMIVEDKRFDTYEEANSEVQSIKSDLLGGE